MPSGVKILPLAASNPQPFFRSTSIKDFYLPQTDKMKELERFKIEVNLVEYAMSYGYNRLDRNKSCKGNWVDANRWDTAPGADYGCGFDEFITFDSETEATYYHYSTTFGGDWDNIFDSVEIPLTRN